jgi:hypothetical protein
LLATNPEGIFEQMPIDGIGMHSTHPADPEIIFGQRQLNRTGRGLTQQEPRHEVSMAKERQGPHYLNDDEPFAILSSPL